MRMVEKMAFYVRRLTCRMFGHRFTWDAKIDRDGFVCPRCSRLVRSASGRDAKFERRAMIDKAIQESGE